MPKPIFDPDNKYVRYGGVVLFAVCYMSFIILVEVIRFLRKIMKGIVDIYCEYVVTIENILTVSRCRVNSFHHHFSVLQVAIPLSLIGLAVTKIVHHCLLTHENILLAGKMQPLAEWILSRIASWSSKIGANGQRRTWKSGERRISWRRR